jgi:hypothetical protein
MTTSEMLAIFRFRMEDPAGEKWDSSSLTQIYQIFTDAQRITVKLLADAEKYQYLRELQVLQSGSMSGGSIALSSDFFVKQFLKDSQDRFVKVFDSPPDKFDKITDFSEDDKYSAYGYVFATKLYLQGYQNTSGTYVFGYIKKPAIIDSTHNPELCDYANQLTTLIATWLAWGLDRQFDRQNAITQEITVTYGVKIQQ